MKMSIQQRAALVAASWKLWLYATLPDVLAVAGAGLCSYGAWSIYPPAGYITAGVLLISGAVLASRRLA